MLLSLKAWRAGLLAAVACLGATACATTGAPAPSTSIVAVGPVAAPNGFLDLCLEQPEACGSETTLPILPQVEMNDDLWTQVNRINRGANRAIRYVSDATFGRPDVWRIATTVGDCEDYALAKRAAMMDVGFPATALRLATVYSRRTGHHAVLVLTTTDGDYVLDNTRDVILPWEQTQFAWVSVQSSGDPMQWLRVASRTSDMADLSAVATAGG